MTRTTMRSRSRPSALSSREQSLVWQSASLLLGYPDDRLLTDLPLVRLMAEALPTAWREPLSGVVEHLATTPSVDAQAAYVETFDTRRRHNLFLTYFAHGDTRKRGMALLRFKQTYLRSGFVLDDAELPDHLCVVLEYAATVDREAGRALILDNRAGVELLRLSLRDAGSPWASVVEAVTATLPPLRGDEWDAVRRLASEGPPEEEVGLAPFATPELSASAVSIPAAGPQLLPLPTFPGARS
jgi:nitrate reductase molybdenum cofactor assembly chaperone NarJ/NarW